LVEVWTCNESKLICHSERTNTALKWENKKKHHTRRQINKTTTRHLGDENTKNNNSKNVSNTYLDKWWKKSLLTSRGFFFLVIFFLLPHPIELFLYVGVGIKNRTNVQLFKESKILTIFICRSRNQLFLEQFNVDFSGYILVMNRVGYVG
jgi:hypothetical protein